MSLLKWSVTTRLLSIARFKALSARRRGTDAKLDETIEATVADSADDPEITLQKKSRNELLRQAMSNLSAEHRPAATLIAVLLNPTWPTFDTQLNDVQEAAQRDRAEAGGRGAGLPAGTRRDRAAGRIVNMEPERATKGPIILRKRFGS